MTKQIDQAVEPAVKWFLALVVVVFAVPILGSAWTIWHEWSGGVNTTWYLGIAIMTLLGVWLTLSEEADAKAPGISTGGYFTGVAVIIVIIISLVTLILGILTPVSMGDAWSISARFWWGGVVVIATSCACWAAEKVHIPWLGTPRI